jgi:hypothetical protein
MRTIWEQVNSDLVEYRELGFRLGVEAGLTLNHLPVDPEGVNLDALDPVAAATLIDAYYAGHDKGVDARISLAR